jgi:hypothetical protein
MKPYNEAEQVFMQDVREKKRAASGVHSKTGSRGYVGKMLFPTDFMSRKEKYNYRKAGKCVTTNLYDNILSIDEFNNMETHEQRNWMAYWRTKYSNKEIQKEMGVNNSKYYSIVGQLGLPKAERSPRSNAAKPRKAAIKVTAVTPEPDIILEPFETPPSRPAAAPEPIKEIINGLHVIFNGTYNADQISKQLTKMQLLLDGEEDNFYIELKIVQKGEE